MAREGDLNKAKEAELMAVPNLNMECIRSLRATRKKLIKNGADEKRSPAFEPGQNSPTAAGRILSKARWGADLS